ncbi:glycoside hydrolase superfamily [Crepidotus variabilis]|uniref:Glycoside hydrolase superfamily n=1 Tax=Crepidotus variabilis TaxID=179855 RepID=A0A9P6E9B5_9AGAR|nr:glycoside hydrolase superfamily [Crepidotus variabilis]
MKFTQKLENTLGLSNSRHVRAGSLVTVTLEQLSPRDFFYYRRQCGVNLGSWFVLERWIADRLFIRASPPAQSDLDIAKGLHAKDLLESHWDSWITDADFKWMVARGFNSVRIPIGYYHLCGADPSVIVGTDFEPFYNTYSGAWDRIKGAILTAQQYSMGVLIDLHAAPGKQNKDAHSGASGPSKFFSDANNSKKALSVLETLLNALPSIVDANETSVNNIIGIEVLNEPDPPSDQQLQNWYDKAISRIRQIDPSVPIYLGDCWRTESYADYIARRPKFSPVFLDHHLYRCFTSSDIATSAAEHSSSLLNPTGPISQTLSRAAESLGRAGGGIIVGEWSAALNPGSLRGTFNEQRAFVDAQLDLFERYCGGWFFWTYKKQHGGDTGWSLRDAVQGGVFPPTIGIQNRSKDLLKDSSEKRASRRAQFKDQALGAHVQYWDQHPGSYHHDRFSEGFDIGWNEAYDFMTWPNDSSPFISRLGFKAARAYVNTTDHGKSYWEYEHGFIQGVNAAEKDYHTMTFE